VKELAMMPSFSTAHITTVFMYVGHFAVGLALKARFPKTPAFPLLMGAGFLDMLNGIFIIMGWNTVTANLAAGPYLFFDLTFIDRDHSLLAALFWSLVWGAFFLKDKRVAALAFASAFLHIVADWPMHNQDMALYPHSPEHVGLGLWGAWGTWSWIAEGLFVLVLMTYAYRANALRGVNWFWPSVFLAVLWVKLSPWLSPMKLVATLPEPWTHLIHGGLVTIGFVVPGLILIWLLNRAERLRGTGKR
jgi:hypothetical protein